MVTAATRACEQTGWKDTDKIDALATVHADANNLDAAARWREVASAIRLCELSKWKDPQMLNALAAACAEAGQLDAAVKWQTQANALHAAGKEKSDGEARLKLYQAKKPNRATRR